MREESAKFIGRAESSMRKELAGPSNIDRAVDHYVLSAKSQAGIAEAIKKMAYVIAEAAVATQKAIGDPTDRAISKWIHIMSDEARRIVEEMKGTQPKEIGSGTVIDQEKS
jgi:hypothetical protein